MDDDNNGVQHIQAKFQPSSPPQRPPKGKGVRQSVVVTNNPSSIDQNQQLPLQFPNLGAHDIIVPRIVSLAFTISLTSTDTYQTIVQNIGYAIVRKTVFRISGNEAWPHLTPWDIGMVVMDTALAMVTKDLLVKQGVLPVDIIK